MENILQVLNNQNYKQWCGIISYPLAWKLCGKAKLTSLYSRRVNFFFNSHSHQQESLLKVLSVITCMRIIRTNLYIAFLNSGVMNNVCSRLFK